MSIPHLASPDLPETMTWEELKVLPQEIAQYIELRDGRPVWIAEEVLAKHGPSEHQRYSRRFNTALEATAREATRRSLGPCWDAEGETNVFLTLDRSSFVTPDFMVFRCLEHEFDWIYADDVVLVGEVLSPANTPRQIDEKKARYAAGKIPWYWEVELGRNPRHISSVRAFGLFPNSLALPEGVTSLRSAHYALAEEWTFDDDEGIETMHPFPIKIPWADLAY
ncbi:Uma2 family endonuclease [Nocardia sp. NEAU-G5]|uniref:Uma2 family endonuclease n=1 Tax=Nocardia albiluteola TaxID=2842303 RepID=A0ABS6B5U9_9NOCA|nr:Uma2 family endonuclease [Nocardia albiluteola]MBU3062474.1 Uma2 family endonuclease [Nocardia albiluteola]MBU3065692.1 Uma2 family endonuclease [Nocardia albiluteola]